MTRLISTDKFHDLSCILLLGDRQDRPGTAEIGDGGEEEVGAGGGEEHERGVSAK
jgi:hypothetical protein